MSDNPTLQAAHERRERGLDLIREYEAHATAIAAILNELAALDRQNYEEGVCRSLSANQGRYERHVQQHLPPLYALNEVRLPWGHGGTDLIWPEWKSCHGYTAPAGYPAFV